MNKNILKCILCCFSVVLWISCNDAEGDLLEPKVYFGENEFHIEVPDGQDEMQQDLQARVSSLHASEIQVVYEIAGESLVSAYNTKNGTNYEAFRADNVKLSSETSVIAGGETYANKVEFTLSGLKEMEEGKAYILPVRIKSASLPVIAGTDVVYYIISKPVRIMKAASFSNHYIKVPFQPGKVYSSLTYETLIHINTLGSNNTIMGGEGLLILRIGDQALPGGHNDWIQIAGNKQFHSTESFVTGKWYHVAFTYDQPSGKAVIYINGNKAAEATWDTAGFDLSAGSGGFFIGKVNGFMWGERPFNGYMCEARVWNVARSENQIKQNMLSVDPASEGLEVYYKLNGTDLFEEGNTYYIKDASGHGMDGQTNSLDFVELESPVAIK